MTFRGYDRRNFHSRGGTRDSRQLSTFIQLGVVALVEGQKDCCFAKRVQQPDSQQCFDDKRVETGRHPGLTEQTREIDDARRVTLREHLPLLKVEADMTGWPFKGRRAVTRFLREIDSSGNVFVAYPINQRTISGVAPGSSVGQEYGSPLCHFVGHDQLHVLNCAPAEQIARRLSCLNARSSDFRALQTFRVWKLFGSRPSTQQKERESRISRSM